MTDQESVTLRVDAAGGARPDVVWLESARLRLGFVPALGGRLLSARLGDVETLWRDDAVLDDDLHPVTGHVPAPHDGEMSRWVNYGGDKTWPAPQGWSSPQEWAGPPDPVLDSGAYAWEGEQHEDGSAVVRMTSAPDPRTGLVLERRFRLGRGESGYDLRVTATNVSGRSVRWALWNVSQRAAGPVGQGGVWVDVDADASADPVPLVVGTGTPVWDAVGPAMIRVPHQDVVGKLGFPTASGRLSHAAGGTTTTMTFDAERLATYPDRGSRAEVWMEHPLESPLEHLGGLRPSHRIVEIEVLGPLRDLAPGETMSLDVRVDMTIGASAPEGSGAAS
ncbi:MAG: DUF4380 domain-containing protein [Microbacterium sp.]